CAEQPVRNRRVVRDHVAGAQGRPGVIPAASAAAGTERRHQPRRQSPRDERHDLPPSSYPAKNRGGARQRRPGPSVPAGAGGQSARASIRLIGCTKSMSTTAITSTKRVTAVKIWAVV